MCVYSHFQMSITSLGEASNTVPLGNVALPVVAICQARQAISRLPEMRLPATLSVLLPAFVRISVSALFFGGRPFGFPLCPGFQGVPLVILLYPSVFQRWPHVNLNRHSRLSHRYQFRRCQYGIFRQVKRHPQPTVGKG